MGVVVAVNDNQRLQKELKIETLMSINEFKTTVRNVVMETCSCFS